MNFYAFDFETASYDKHSACSIAIVKVENSQIVDEFYTLIKPETPFSGGIRKFTAFMNQMLSMRPNSLKYGNKFSIVFNQIG